MKKNKTGAPRSKFRLLQAGGTKRLPRLAGISAALQIMTSGKPISASEALKLGEVDKISTIYWKMQGLAKQVAERIAIQRHQS